MANIDIPGIGYPSKTNPDAPALIVDFDDFEDGRNPYAFLSNFWRPNAPYSIPRFDEAAEEDGGVLFRAPVDDWKTTEHYFAAMKADPRTAEGREWRQRIAEAPLPGKAKSLGRQCPLRPGWEGMKRDVMRVAVAYKFYPGGSEAEALLRTGDAMLVEGTTWGDQVWGVDTLLPRWPGYNWLGMLLMARRAELRSLSLKPFRVEGHDPAERAMNVMMLEGYGV